MAIELADFVGQPCKSRVAYEFIPKQDCSLELGAVAGQLRKKGVFIEIETPFLLMLKAGGKDVSLFKSGKIIVKATTEKDAARKIAQKVLENIET
ncbi:MAG TPA: hypothetical protein HA254_07010 [Candidatus Diapherotrites archaeon]|uniref:Uncharacterized protein n=1 Tax=Candidatus Iainarchaeum sp. TaxID=3101447 RepID=A0A7J4IZQ8_9ARCH|nr:hypothetical protein [Candidatus Diapherotrites archaeon]